MLRRTPASAPAIAFAGVNLGFRTPGGAYLPVLKDFDMSVACGEFAALVGPTGCGKSTTLNLLTGLLRPVSGDVSVMGSPVTGIDRRIGFVFQADALFPWRSVIDNVVVGPRYHGIGKAEAYDRAHRWLATVGLSKFANHYPHQLSGGMRKRVALAQTLVNEPEIVLMDEPFSALDVQTRVRMQDELLRLWSESRASVVFVTHDLDEAIALADKVYVLTAGPASVKAVYEVDLPRPRVTSEIRYEHRFIDLSRQIWNDFREEVRIGQSRAELA